MTEKEALDALNALRSNVVGTQSAGWSNLIYPLVAILNAAGLEVFDPTEEQMRDHMNAYGGAGGYPGNILREADRGWCEPISKFERLQNAARKFLADPSDENRRILESQSSKQ